MTCFYFIACLTLTGRGALCTTQGSVNPANGVYGKQHGAIYAGYYMWVCVWGPLGLQDKVWVYMSRLGHVCLNTGTRRC